LPELPETETIKRELEDTVVGLRITAVDVPIERVLRMDATEFVRRIEGTTITGAGRRAKIIMLHLSSGETLLFHLMMAGSLLYQPVSMERKEKTQVVFVLENDYELRYKDFRLFGYVKLLARGDVAQAPEFAHLGPEPLADDFTLEVFRERLASRPRACIKALLLDQSFVAGLGNIYVDEILFYARVHPLRRAGTLTVAESARMYEGIRTILARAIAERGSSFSLFVDLFGNPGNYHNLLSVYGQTGKPCPGGCPGVVEKIKVAGRGTHICARCQK
jgi:formamidopyrimidine-DNA glycosylase